VIVQREMTNVVLIYNFAFVDVLLLSVFHFISYVFERIMSVT
jgi:hypothetical protein